MSLIRLDYGTETQNIQTQPTEIGARAMNQVAPANQQRNANAQPLQAPHAVMSPPQPFQIPTAARYINPQTGRVQMRVIRVRANGLDRKDRLICYAEGQDGLYPAKALFVAECHARGQYRIFDASQEDPQTVARLSSHPRFSAKDYKDDPRFAGEVQRSANTFRGYVEYKLVRDDPRTKSRSLVSTIIYNKRALHFRVVNGTADRIVYNVVEDSSKVNNEVSTTKKEENTDEAPHFSSLGKPVIEHIEDDIHKIGEEHEELKVFQSKRRFTNAIGKARHRDLEPFDQKFQGRALLPSKKNLQIMDVSSGKVHLQVGRLNHDVFALDLLPPYTPFQAMGVMLAQLDAN